MPAGSITAIIGPSGSGKTSFLNALSQRISGKMLQRSGEVLYNGDPVLSSVRNAYVMQQDILLPTLTVRETLHYSAELRLPAPSAAEERRAMVEQVILELGLKDCADTRIGNNEHKGCSGGEKRRTSLGVQLLANPSVLFLDEVTTGLDATSAHQLVETLRQLANRGRTVIMTIHQPCSEIWGLFDHLVLLSGGCSIYTGSADQCLDYFESQGHPLPSFMNPAEHLIDLAAVDHRSHDLETASRVRIEQLKHSWKNSPDLEPKLSTRIMGKTSSSEIPPRRASFAHHVRVQASRTFKTACRDPMGVTGSIVQGVSMAVLTGWIFFGLDETQSGIRSREGALYTAAALQNYLNLLFETYRLTLEIGVFDREYAEGVVDVCSFLISRRIARFPIEDFPIPLIYSVIFYFMVGFRQDAEGFLVFFGFMLLSQYTAATLAMLTVAFSRDFAGALLIGNMNFTIQSMCSGFFIQSNQIPVYVRWLKWIAYAWYANGALAINEFIGNSDTTTGYLYDCSYPNGTSNPACEQWTGRFVVALLGYPQDHWIWRPAVVLLGFICLFSISAGLVFSFFKVELNMSHQKKSKQDTSIGQDRLRDYPIDQGRMLDVSLERFGLDIEIRSSYSWKTQRATILRPLNVCFKPGMLNVIMGVSGGGKTSLLNLIAGRLFNTYRTRYKPSGTMLFGDATPSSNVVRSITSYVSQSDDALLPNLTKRFFFAAQLRLPTWMTTADKSQRAEEFLPKLGLSDCADTLIGDDQVKGISGGEKRRVSIAIQILTEPRILLLDEPTSGLDASTASSIIALLRDLAAEGSTVILSIHQPRSDIFHHFGSILLLARGGKPVYAGPGRAMLLYFSSLGYPCPKNVNPADFALDLISVDLRSSQKESRSSAHVDALTDLWAETQSEGFKSSHAQNKEISLPASLASFHRERTASLIATRLLLQRSLLSMIRSPPIILARTLQVIGFAILVTLFFAPLHFNYPGVQSYIGFVQEILGLYFIGMLQNVAVYPTEKVVFYNEYDEDVYGVEPFFVTYTLLELPFEVITVAIFSLLAIFAVGLPHTGPVFGVVTFVSFALVNCGESVGMIFNTLFESTGFAVSLTSIVLSLGLLMAGVISTHVPPFLEAFNYLSPSKWSIAALAPYTLTGLKFTCQENEKVTLASGTRRCPIETGKDVLELYHLNNDGRLALVYLAVVNVGYRMLAYVLLKVVKSRWKW